MSKIISIGIPGQAIKLQDVVSVIRGALVEIDQHAAQRIKQESPAPSSFTAEPDAFEAFRATQGPFRLLESRAAAAVALLLIVNGKSRVRLQVVEQIVSWLNDQAGEVSTVQDQLSACRIDEGSLPSDDIKSESAEAGSAPKGLTISVSKEERELLCMEHLPVTGLAALAVAGARQLRRTSLALTALGFEALEADVKDLEADKVESACSPSTAAMAGEVRDMINESSRTKSKKGGHGHVSCLLEMPAAAGALEDVLNRIEPQVQSLISASVSDAALVDRLKPSQGLALSLTQLSALLNRAAHLSYAASQKIRTYLEEAYQEFLKARGLDGNLQSKGTDNQDGNVKQAGVNGHRDYGSDIGTALCALTSVNQLLEAQSCQAEASLLCLAAQGVTAHEPDAADGKAAKSKKKAKGGGTSLGIGTSRFRLWLQGGSPFEQIAKLAEIRQRLGPYSEQLCRELDLLQQLVQSNAKLRKPKVAKGARDFLPDQMAIREQAFRAIGDVFKLHGAVSIDTPVFELKETLTGKYGEDSKLIYDLKDQGGELLSLRYDLTVPFARFVALNGITNIKRYHIAKVYRRDQPQTARGRYREFYQCDFDVAGNSPLMVADAEVLKVLTEILDKLDLGKFTVKINHRVLLDGMMNLCGVPASKFRTICSAIDKLDKEPWETVRAEMVEDKGLDSKVADKIGTFVGDKGEPKSLLAKLCSSGHDFAKEESCSRALAELKVLFELLDMMGALYHFSFDLSLARGLDYYTGVIYEAVLEGANVGSIAAGGRYDNLVGMFSGKQVPAVGVSLGIERIFAILEEKHRRQAAASNGKIRETNTQVLVMSASKDMQFQRIRLASELWAHGIASEFGYKANPFMPEQMSHATTSGIPLCVVLRPDEVKQGTVEIMETVSGAKEVVPRHEVIGFIQKKLETLGPLDLVVPGRAETA